MLLLAWQLAFILVYFGLRSTFIRLFVLSFWSSALFHRPLPIQSDDPDSSLKSRKPTRLCHSQTIRQWNKFIRFVAIRWWWPTDLDQAANCGPNRLIDIRKGQLTSVAQFVDTIVLIFRSVASSERFVAAAASQHFLGRRSGQCADGKKCSQTWPQSRSDIGHIVREHLPNLRRTPHCVQHKLNCSFCLFVIHSIAWMRPMWTKQLSIQITNVSSLLASCIHLCQSKLYTSTVAIQLLDYTVCRFCFVRFSLYIKKIIFLKNNHLSKFEWWKNHKKWYLLYAHRESAIYIPFKVIIFSWIKKRWKKIFTPIYDRKFFFYNK